LAKQFQMRRLKCVKLTDDRWHMPSDGKSSHCLCQVELMTNIPQISIPNYNWSNKFIKSKIQKIKSFKMNP
jgi:hypothetical protein